MTQLSCTQSIMGHLDAMNFNSQQSEDPSFMFFDDNQCSALGGRESGIS